MPRPLCGLSEACLFSSPTGPARKRSCTLRWPRKLVLWLPKATLDTHGPRPQTLLGSRQACRGLSVACPKPASSLHPRAPPAPGLPKATLDTPGPRPQTFLQAAAWFLWASEGNVRHPRAPPSCRGLSVACPKPAKAGLLRGRFLFRRVVLALRNSPAFCRALFSCRCVVCGLNAPKEQR